MNFEVKIVTYKLTDLKKEVQDAIMLLATGEYLKAEECECPELWNGLVNAEWASVNVHGYYELTRDGLALIREHNRRKLKRRWYKL